MVLISRALETARRSLGLFAILAAMCGVAQAQTQTPEIDPLSAGPAIALLVSGFYLFKGPRRQK